MPNTQHTKLILHFALNDINNFGSLFYEEIWSISCNYLWICQYFFFVRYDGGMFWQTLTPESLGCVTATFGAKEIPLPNPIK